MEKRICRIPMGMTYLTTSSGSMRNSWKLQKDRLGPHRWPVGTTGSMTPSTISIPYQKIFLVMFLMLLAKLKIVI